MKKYGIAVAVAVMAVAAGCSKKSTIDSVDGVTNASAVETKAQRPAHHGDRKGERMTRRTYLVYKMSGDYANLVPVTLDGNGDIHSYPDPVDVGEWAKPVALGDGWYLDRRGISMNTVFLDYTYEEYHALPSVPSRETLKQHIKVRNGITEIWNCGTTQRTFEEYKELVKKGFKGCKRVY